MVCVGCVFGWAIFVCQVVLTHNLVMIQLAKKLFHRTCLGSLFFLLLIYHVIIKFNRQSIISTPQNTIKRP